MRRSPMSRLKRMGRLLGNSASGPQLYTFNSTTLGWVPPADGNYDITIYSAGGGGAGGDNNTLGGSGGGGGPVRLEAAVALTVDNPIDITIGAGGAGGALEEAGAQGDVTVVLIPTIAEYTGTGAFGGSAETPGSGNPGDGFSLGGDGASSSELSGSGGGGGGVASALANGPTATTAAGAGNGGTGGEPNDGNGTNGGNPGGGGGGGSRGGAGGNGGSGRVTIYGPIS